MPPVTSIGVYEAKTHFSEYAERAAHGEEITITRHGVPFFRWVPVDQQRNQEAVNAAVDDLLAFNKGRRLKGITVKQLREEGRR